jgi:hypothetical protein
VKVTIKYRGTLSLTWAIAGGIVLAWLLEAAILVLLRLWLVPSVAKMY